MSSGTNTERITQNNGIISENNVDLEALKARINNLPTSADTTATAGDILRGKTAISKGVKLTGTYTPPVPYLQNKQVTISQNGLTVITPDTGYDGLSSVGITVNVGGSSEYNAKIVTPHRPAYGNNKTKCIDYIEEVKNIDFSFYTGQYATRSSGFFQDFSSLKNISGLTNTNVLTTIQTFFYNCYALQDAPLFDTSNNNNMQYTFGNCYDLRNVPIYNTEKVLNFTNTFSNCSNLTSESLNNILYMLAHATAYINQGTNMTLAFIGLSQAQATTCQTLSNWQDCVTAGWTTGY